MGTNDEHPSAKTDHDEGADEQDDVDDLAGLEAERRRGGLGDHDWMSRDRNVTDRDEGNRGWWYGRQRCTS